MTINVGDLRHMEEAKSAPSARIASGAIVSDPARHVLRLKIRFTGHSWSSSDAHGCTFQHGSHIVLAGVQAPGELGLLPQTEGGSNPPSPTVGSNGMGVGSPGTSFALANYVLASAPSAAYGGGTTYWNLYPSLGAAGTLSSGTLRVRAYRRDTTSITYAAPGAVHYPSDMTSEMESYLDVQKLLCEAVSLDSRKAYGQPNLDGALPGDPNAELDYVSFKDWVFKGGAFVGNMPTGSGDLSGEGRLQIRYLGGVPSSPYLASCLTAFATSRKLTGAKPSVAASTAYVGIYRPVATDPNLNVGDLVRWSTRWNIVPQTAATSPVDYSKNAFQMFEITDAMQAQYANWQMPYKVAAASPPHEIWTRAALALPQLYGPTWQSFSTTQYQATPNATFPITDSAVRIWRVGQL